MSNMEEIKSKVIDEILEGKKMTEIAKDNGLYRSLLYRWLKDELFKAELETRRAQLRKSASDKITGRVNNLVDKMLDLAENSTDNRVKYNAIKYLLDRALGTPVAAKEDVNNVGNDKDNKDANTLKQELDDIKNLQVIK
ncbi:phage-like protein [Clostridium carnis]|uniref:Phage-like protein n=1 Tax=Clostridium carnis TaxID=1530 RepID=A0ABY6T0V8_9CLOT|nr:helix-turn-helix domain-containing protein [Clostridium carnis]VDG74692.1 phage-like protein [Clostridium carnis]